MKKLNTGELVELFTGMEQKLYTKRGLFIFREAARWPAYLVTPHYDGGYETVLTIVAGKLETLQEAKAGDIVVRNIVLGGSAETYVIPRATFEKRYAVQGDGPMFMDGYLWYKATARGQVMAAEYAGEPVEFQAIWGENMICEAGDFLATPVGGDPLDIYRIEREAFEKTYGEK